MGSNHEEKVKGSSNNSNSLTSKVEAKPRKTGGRTKGTPNKNSLLFRKALDRADVDLVAETIKAISGIPNPNERAEKLLEMFPYIYPKLKEVEELPMDPAEEAIDITPDEETDFLKGV